MAKALSLAALLGAIAIISVSFLAQAEPQSTPVATTVTTTATTTAVTPTQPVAAADKLAKDTAECTAAASITKADGTHASGADKEASVKSCLEAKGHKHVAAETVTPDAVEKK